MPPVVEAVVRVAEPTLLFPIESRDPFLEATRPVLPAIAKLLLPVKLLPLP